MDLLFQGGTALLPGGTLGNCDIYVSGGRIISLNGAPEGAKNYRSIDCTGRLITPGLVNAHTHAYMSVLRCCGDDLGFSDWLFGRVMPLEDRMTPEEARISTLLGCMEMLQSGVTAFLDMHMFPGAVAEAVDAIGMKAVLSRGLSGGGEDAAGGARRIREALAEIESLQGHPRISGMLAPHALYTCTEDYLREIADLSAERGLRLHTHLAESQSETDTALEQHGCTPAEYYERCGLLRPGTVAAHCVRLTHSDMQLLADRGVFVALNSASNLKLQNGIAPAAAMEEAGIRLCLGTDGAASNNSLSLLREMALCGLLHEQISAPHCLVMATETGADALGLPETGRVAPGMRADLAVFDLRGAGQQPVYDARAALVYANAGLRAESVYVDGVPVMEKGIFQTIDAEAILHEAGRIGEKYRKILEEQANV